MRPEGPICRFQRSQKYILFWGGGNSSISKHWYLMQVSAKCWTVQDKDVWGPDGATAALWAVPKGSGGHDAPPPGQGSPRPRCGPTVVRLQLAFLCHRPPAHPLGRPAAGDEEAGRGRPTCPPRGRARRSAHRPGRCCPHTRSAEPSRGAAASGGPALQPAEPGGVLRDWTVHRARSACEGQSESGPIRTSARGVELAAAWGARPRGPAAWRGALPGVHTLLCSLRPGKAPGPAVRPSFAQDPQKGCLAGRGGPSHRPFQRGPTEPLGTWRHRP